MNIPRILALASAIENGDNPLFNDEPVGFNMDFFAPHEISEEDWGDHQDMTGNDCGTVACIGGWANVLAGAKDLRDEKSAAEWFDLDTETAKALFYIGPEFSDYAEVTTAQASRTLRHLAATGIVDWNLPTED